MTQETIIHDATIAVIQTVLERLFWLYPEAYQVTLAAELYQIVQAGMEAAFALEWKNRRGSPSVN